MAQQHDMDTIEVRGFKETTSDYTLVSFFENKRRSGGGEITKYKVDRANNVFTATYAEPGVAKRVLGTHGLILEEAALKVSPAPDDWDRKTIEVCGIKSSTTDDAIELFFESNHRSGGDMVDKMQRDKDKEVAYVTFENPGVAEQVIAMRNLKLDGATLTVQKVSRCGHESLASSNVNQNPAGKVFADNAFIKRDKTTKVSPAQDAWDRKTIEVSGIKITSTDDAIQLFFESKRHSGGDIVEKKRRGTNKTVAYVTFENPGVAENVIAMRNLTLDGATLTVKKAIDSWRDLSTSGNVIQTQDHRRGRYPDGPRAQDVWDGKTIEVSGIKTSTTDDAIELFFESKRAGSDTVTNMDRHTDRSAAKVTFENAGVAEKVISMSKLCLDGATLAVKKAKGGWNDSTTSINVKQNQNGKVGDAGDSSPTQDVPMTSRASGFQKHDFSARPRGEASTKYTRAPAPQPAAPSNTVMVKGISQKTSKEMLKMFFENKRRSGGGPVDSIDYQRFRHYATVTFHNVGDALSVLQRGHFTLEDAELTVTEVTVDDNTTHKTTDKQGAVRKRTPTSSDKDNTPVRIVKITGLKPGTSKTVIEMFVENKSGESELESCDIDEDTGVAMVEFKSPKGASNLMNAGRLELCGAPLTVCSLSDVYAGLDRESCRLKAVKVSGIGSDTSRDFLEVFFENRHRSGGGNIDYLEYGEEDSIAVITFEDADSASRVAQKASLVVNDVQVQVKLMRPSMHLVEVQGPFEDDTFILSGVSPKCTGDDVKAFFSTSDLDSEIQQVIFTQQPGVVMLQFVYPPPEFYSLRALCVTKPLRGTMISVQRVAQTRTIQVHNISSLTEDILGLYFENKKKSGGGKVIRVEITEEGYALVEVAENSTVKSILATRTHSFDNKTLQVAAFYDSVGIISPNEDCTRPGGWIPKSVTVTGLDERLASFIVSTPGRRKLVDSKMADVSASVEWNTYSDTSRSIELTCTITHTSKNSQHLAKTWSQDAPKTFFDVMKKEFACEDINILQQAWAKFVELLTYTENQDPSKVYIDVDAAACTVRVTGQRSEVQAVSARLKRDHSLVQGEITRLSKFVTEVKKDLPLHCLRMLNANAFKSNQEAKFQDMKVDIDMKSLEVEFNGMPEDVISAKTAMFDILNNMTEKSVVMSGTLISLINSAVLKKHLVEQFRIKQICAVFDNNVESKALMVYALNDKALGIAVETVKIETGEQPFPCDVTNISDSEKWAELVSKLESEHTGLLVIRKSKDGVVVSGAAEPFDQAVGEVKRFLEDVVSEKFAELEYGIADYMKKHMENKVNKAVENIQHVTARVETDGRCGIVVTGYEQNLQQAMQKLQKLARDIKSDRFVLDKPGMPKFLDSLAGKQYLTQLESNHQVVIVDEEKLSQRGAEGGMSMSRGGGVVGSKVDLEGGATIEVIQGDLTAFHADAIVNAANGQLKHAGGLAYAISYAGGSDIQRECDDHVRRNGVLTAGQVCVTTAGRLPCNKVIHAVGPRWSGGRNNEETDLYNATYESLLAAENVGLSSVAFPALSCGIFGYPVNQATKTIVLAMKEFLEDQQHTNVKKVSLVDRSDKIVRELNNSLRVVFGSRVVVTSRHGQDTPHKTAGSQPPPTRSHHLRKRTEPASTGLSTPEGITLKLCKSELANEKVDAIVNSTNNQLQLDKGFVSKALLDIGGKILQRECQQNAPDGIQAGQVVVTSGGKLKCQIVIHAACCRWDGGGGRSEQVLRSLLGNCFQEAHNIKARSIAIPPIGIGRLGFDPHFVASVMREEVFEFSQQYPQTSLKEVRFVVYQKDTPSLQAFEDVLSGSVPSIGDVGFGQAPAPAREDDVSPLPSHHSMKPTTAATTELSTPEGITLSLRQSEIVNEKVDAIVNSTNRQLQLDTGFVSKAILKKGGKTIQKECQQYAPNGIQSGDVVVTSGGNLSCKFVIHGACCKWDGGAGGSERVLRKFISNCFEEARKNNVSSVAIPPIGVGGLGFDPAFVASVMRDELFEFSRRNPQTTLREVRFVVYQKDTASIQAFQEVLSGRDSSTPGRERELAGARPKQREGRFLDGRNKTRSASKRSITFTIYAQSTAVIDRVARAIEDHCKTECQDVVLDSQDDQDAITKLTEREIQEIQSLEDKFNVKVTINDKTSRKSILIQGLTVDTSQANVKISNIFRHVEVADVKKLQQSLISKMVHWSYQDGDNFTDYPDEINSLLEKALQDMKDKYEWTEIDGVTFSVDFRKMVETTHTHRTVVPVKRSPVGGSIELPSNWTSMDDRQHVKLVDIQKGNTEYAKVETEFMHTAQGTVNGVIKIERVQNLSLYRLYVLRRDDMEKRQTKPRIVERSLWHGTDVAAVDSINTAGFNRSYCGKNATYFGKGVYFAMNTSYPAGRGYAAPDRSGHKRIYKTLVLTGDYTKGVADMPVPPNNPANPGFTFDSTVDNVSTPAMFVVFLDNMAYPEYLITFT